MRRWLLVHVVGVWDPTFDAEVPWSRVWWELRHNGPIRQFWSRYYGGYRSPAANQWYAQVLRLRAENHELAEKLAQLTGPEEQP